MASCDLEVVNHHGFAMPTMHDGGSHVHYRQVATELWERPAKQHRLSITPPFFARKTATSSVSGTNESNVTTAAKKTKPDQPKQPGERKHVAKHVMVAQRVDMYGKCGLYDHKT